METIAAQPLTLSRYSFFTHPVQALQDYYELGYHIEPNIYSDAECNELIRLAMGELRDPANHDAPIIMPHRKHPAFLTALKNPKLIHIMNAVIGNPVSGLQSEFFYCKPGTQGFLLHQDNYHVQAQTNLFASAWTALTDTDAEKGGLIVAPRSHLAGDLPVKKIGGVAMGHDPNAHSIEVILPEQYPLINAVVPKGATLIIHGHLVHGSNPNQTNDWRYVLLNTYIRSGAKFRPGFYAQRAEVKLD